MKLNWYPDRPSAKRPEKKALERLNRGMATDPSGYEADEELAAAINVALFLGQPLLVTGEPGTGKTQLAGSIAWELGLDEPFIFSTKSTSVAKDLFYSYDAVGRFSARDSEGRHPHSFFELQALGRAILDTQMPDGVPKAISPLASNEEPKRRVVLIDEIDKAPRDFPNDLLHEIEEMRFRIPELSGEWIRAAADYRPIVVMTSNSEKHLPAAFLRRCVYYHIGPPDPQRLRRIVTQRLAGVVEVDLEADPAKDDSWLGRALSLFAHLREPVAGLEKRPSTSELLAWLRILAIADGDLLGSEAKIMGSLVILVKSQRDREVSRSVVKTWLSSRAKS